jgi:hypothetical protein
MTCLELLEEWLAFSRSLDNEWWAVSDKQDPETVTWEGEELKRLQQETGTFLVQIEEKGTG